MDRFIEFLLTHRRKAALLGVLLSSTLVFLTRIPRIDGSLDGFEIPDNPHSQILEELAFAFRTRPVVQVRITPSDTTVVAVLEDLRRLEMEVQAAAPGSAFHSLHSLSPLLSSLGVTRTQPITQALPTIGDFPPTQSLVSRDARSFLALVQVPADWEGDPRAADGAFEIRLPSFQSLEVFSLGKVESEIEIGIRRDTERLSVWILAVAGLFLLFAYRSLRGLVFVATLTAVAVAGVGATLTVLGYDLNIATMLTVPTVIVVSLADAVHLLTGYTALPTGESPEDRLRVTLGRYILPSALTSLTTAVAFFSLMLSDARNLRSMGLATGISVLLAFVVAYLLGPYLLEFLKVSGRQSPRLSMALNRLLEKKAIPGGALLTIIPLSLLALPGLRLGTPPDLFFPQGSQISRTYESITTGFYSMASLHILLEPLQGSAPGTERGTLMNLARSMGDEIELLEGVVLVSSAPNLVDNMLTVPVGLPVLTGILQENPFVSPDGRHQRMEVKIAEGQDIHAVEEKVRAAMQPYSDQVGWKMASSALAMDYVNAHVVAGLLRSFLISTIVIFILVALMVRSIRGTLAALVANLAPLAAAICLFRGLGLEISVFSASVLVISLGLVVDDTLHAVLRLGRSEGDLGELPYSMGTTSLLLASGFFLFLISSFEPVRTLGGIIGVVLLVALIADLTLLPWLFDTRKPTPGN